MALRLFNSANIRETRKPDAITSVMAFRGDKLDNLHGKGSTLGQRIEVVDVAKNTEEMERLRYQIVNAYKTVGDAMVRNSEPAPSQAAIEAFYGRFFVDVTRRVMSAGDLTSLIAREVTDFDFDELLYLRNLLPYRGFMGLVSGENDGVPLIEQNTGATDTLALYIRAIGWKDSIANMLWNRFFTMDKVVQAAVDADTDERNKATIGAIVGSTFTALQKQAADGTSGATFDEKMYNTFRSAIKTLKKLLDVQTGLPITVPTISVLCNSIDSYDIENVIRGQLNGNASSARSSNRPALPISNLIEYDRGINHGFTVGKITGVYPGVTAGKAYVFVPDMAIVANKRPLTMEAGRGSVLALSTEERAWYRVQGTYIRDLLGSSLTGTGLADGYGTIVEVTLPT